MKFISSEKYVKSLKENEETESSTPFHHKKFFSACKLVYVGTIALSVV
jgi:hypothetical protein